MAVKPLRGALVDFGGCVPPQPTPTHAAEVGIADTADNADHLRAAVAAKGAPAVIPSNPSRSRRLPLDRHLYRERHLVECCIGKLKPFRRVATRHEKTARSDRAVVTIAATILWLRWVSTRPTTTVAGFA